MNTSEWITTEQLKSRFGVEDFELLQSINEERLRPYNKALKKLYRDKANFIHWVTVDREEAENKNADLMHRKHIQEDQRAKRGIGFFRIIEPNYTALEDCIFKIDEVSEIWNEKETKSDGKNLSAHAILKQPVFQETMIALKELLFYLDETRKTKKPKRADAEDLFVNHDGLTEEIFRKVWETIPQSFKRKWGERDR